MKMNNHFTLKGFVFICLAFFSNISSATVFTTGDIVRVDFDLSGGLASILSGDTLYPPYEGIYTAMNFGAGDYLNTGDGFTIALFDDGGENLNDGIGNYLLYNIVGSFDLTGASAAGRFYSGGMVTESTDYIPGTISTVSSLPDLNDALSVPYTYMETSGNISWLGMDRHIVLPETSVPEPSSLLLMGIGLAGLIFMRRRKQA